MVDLPTYLHKLILLGEANDCGVAALTPMVKLITYLWKLKHTVEISKHSTHRVAVCGTLCRYKSVRVQRVSPVATPLIYMIFSRRFQ